MHQMHFYGFEVSFGDLIKKKTIKEFNQLNVGELDDLAMRRIYDLCNCNNHLKL